MLHSFIPSWRARKSSLKAIAIFLANVANLVFCIHVLIPILYEKHQVTILVWTEIQGAILMKYLPDVIKTTPNSKTILCPKTRQVCNFTSDKKLIGEANAVWFDGRELTDDYLRKIGGYPPAKLPKGNRREDQAWIFHYRESPAYKPSLFRPFPNIFNWTMTYRSDSDIPFPYGKIQKRLVKRNHNEIFNNQLGLHGSKLVAWTVSNCWPKSNRTQIANELGKLVPLDVYGKCGKYICPQNCYAYQEKIYKFYLAFENSLCEEYVTEKFFKTLKSQMVPVVYGSADYASIAPPRSFINVKDFKSVQKLTEYLLWLDRNPQELAKYFEWKNDFEVVDVNMNVWCDLCEKVAKERDAGWPKKKSWGDLHSWYFKKIPKGVSKMENQKVRFIEPICI